MHAYICDCLKCYLDANLIPLLNRQISMISHQHYIVGKHFDAFMLQVKATDENIRQPQNRNIFSQLQKIQTFKNTLSSVIRFLSYVSFSPLRQFQPVICIIVIVPHHVQISRANLDIDRNRLITAKLAKPCLSLGNAFFL